MSIIDEPDRCTLTQARIWLLGRLVDGADCPTCGQRAKEYQNSISITQARALLWIYEAAGLALAYLPAILANGPTIGVRTIGGKVSKLAYWGLIRDEGYMRDDGGRAGWWRVTVHGEHWLAGRVTVPKYARTYNARCLGLYGSGVSISDALGEPFDLTELLNRRRDAS